MKNKQLTFTLLAFFIWPLFTLIYSLVYYKNQSYKYIVPLFVAFLSLSIQIVPGSDLSSIISDFSALNIDNLSYYIINRFNGLESGGVELYILTLSVLTKLIFFGDIQLFIILQGLVIGTIIIFFLKHFYSTYSYSVSKLISSKVYIFFFIYFVSIFTALNGRFWTAHLIFLYLCISYLSTMRKSYLYYTVLLVFVHQGFIFAPLIALFYLITKEIYKIHYFYYFLLIISFFYSSSGFQFFHDTAYLFDNAYYAHISTYSSKQLTSRDFAIINNNTSWFLVLNSQLLFFTLTFSLFYYRYISRLSYSTKSENLYFFIILFMSFRNITHTIPSLGGRYEYILCSLMLLLFLNLSLDNYIKIYNFPFIVSFLGIAFNFVIQFRMDSEMLYGYFWTLFPVINFIMFPHINFLEVIYH